MRLGSRLNNEMAPGGNLDIFHSHDYSPLLNRQDLSRDLKKDPWNFELNPMLEGFLKNVSGLKRTLRFKVSGKILNSSTYVLKAKANAILNNSLETQEDIKDAQIIKLNEDQELDELEANFDEYDEDNELFEAFTELENEDYFDTSEKESFREAKIQHILNLDAVELNKRLNARVNLIQSPPRMLYKKIELKDLASALDVVLKAKNSRPKAIRPQKKEIIDKSRLPFLPENFIARAEKKRASFEQQIENFHADLKGQYKDEPISFFKLVPRATSKDLVNTLLIILYLINHKKIEIWQPLTEENSELEDNKLENNGQGIYLTPI